MSARPAAVAATAPYVRVSAILCVLSMARVYKKGQITIPKQVRESAGIAIGDRVVVEARDGEVVVRRPRGVLEFEPPAQRDEALPWSEARRAAREDLAVRRRAPSRCDRRQQRRVAVV